MKKVLKRVVIVLVVLLVLIQVVPYGRSHANPPVTGEPAWDSPRTRELAKRACFDCHSNETVWPWYTWVAPVSWLVQSDVDEGREHMNLSEFDKGAKHADDAAEEVEGGDMPPGNYLLMHADARLGDAERAELVRGLKATFGEGGKGRGRGRGQGGGSDDDEGGSD